MFIIPGLLQQIKLQELEIAYLKQHPTVTDQIVKKKISTER